jgi:hypothetical protein
MYTALGIDLCFVRSRRICELRALYDMEVVVCCMAAGVPFGANCSAYVVLVSMKSRRENGGVPNMMRYSVMPVIAMSARHLFSEEKTTARGTMAWSQSLEGTYSHE